MNDIRQYFARHGLVRPSGHRVVGGVCAGVGNRLGLGPWTARALFVLGLMLIPGSQIIVYPILWILMPTDEPATWRAAEGPATPAPGYETTVAR